MAFLAMWRVSTVKECEAMDLAGLSYLDRLPAHYLGEYELLLRILCSAVIGFLIGLDRTHKHKPAGVKTYTYVSAASALITIVSINSAGLYSTMFDKTMMDPMRLAAQVVTGLGFIGAGIILKDGAKVIGLTSAAMIFFAGGVGIGIGAGFYTLILFTVAAAFLFVQIGEWTERREKRKNSKSIAHAADDIQEMSQGM
jgi:putative Mg2+ transporter-C (MgtC) family protein